VIKIEKETDDLVFKTAVIKKLATCLKGGSWTANEERLQSEEIKALKYLVDCSVIHLDMPDKILEGMTKDDKAGRYRLNKPHRTEAEKLLIQLEAEAKKLRPEGSPPYMDDFGNIDDLDDFDDGV